MKNRRHNIQISFNKEKIDDTKQQNGTRGYDSAREAVWSRPFKMIYLRLHDNDARFHATEHLRQHIFFTFYANIFCTKDEI